MIIAQNSNHEKRYYKVNGLKLKFRFKNLTDMMLQEGGSPQTEQQMSEMIKENLTLSVKKGKRCFMFLSLALSLMPLIGRGDVESASNNLFVFRNFFIKFLNCSSLHIFLCNSQKRPVKTLRNKVYLIISEFLQFLIDHSVANHKSAKVFTKNITLFY